MAVAHAVELTDGVMEEDALGVPPPAPPPPLGVAVAQGLEEGDGRDVDEREGGSEGVALGEVEGLGKREEEGEVVL